MKRATALTLAGLVIYNLSRACPVCEKQQPEILRGVTHGAGPSGTIDWVIVLVMVIITLITLCYSIKYIVHPGEKNADHIKVKVLN